MSTLQTKAKEQLLDKKQWPKILMVLAAVVAIALLFPDVSQNQKAGLGSIWESEDLVAENDLVVKKDQKRVDSERLLMSEDFIPIFKIDNAVSPIVLTSVDEALANLQIDTIAFNKTNLINSVRSCITKLYDQGVYHQSELINERVRISRNNKLELMDTDDLIPANQSGSSLKGRCPKANWTENPTIVGIIRTHLQPNLVYDEARSKADLQSNLGEISEIAYDFKKGDVLIRQGQKITDREQRIINAYKGDQGVTGIFKSFSIIHFIGYLLLTCLIIGALLAYLMYHFPKLYDNNLKLGFLLIWPVIFSIIVFFVEKNPGMTSYIIPFCIVPIIIKNFLNDRLALFLHIVIVLIASFLSSEGYEFTFLQILAGIVSILFFTKNFTLNSFFNTILIVFGTYILGFLGLQLIAIESFTDIAWGPFIWLAISAFLTLMAFPLMPLLERAFKFTSPITLNELSDLNKPLLRKLATEAPGTLQHSLQVSNLAHAAAEKIEADTLLVKTAALYHDIGKLAYPEYFIENQSGRNPHENISNFESAEKIIGHTIEGERMAKKARLPQDIIDFITTHHGDTRVEYFYRNQMNNNPDQEFDETLFRYPGPKPQTREQSILMIADSLEAASKSLKNPSGQDIDQLVDNIIAGKIDNNQLDESQLTFHELEQCSEVFKSVLRSINHIRIEYPDEKK